MEIYLFIIAVLFAASFTQGMTGFGFALVSIPLLSMMMELKEAVALGALGGLVVNIYLIIKLRSFVKFFDLKNLIIGSVIGIPLGTYMLNDLSPHILKIILGIIVILFVLLSVFKIIKQRNINTNLGYIFGFASGLLGGALNTNGPPILIYFYLNGYDKFKQKASITGFFLIASMFIVLSHALTGITSTTTLKNFGIALPFILTGIFLGSRAFGKISTLIYDRIILGFLFIVSIYLIFLSR
ncbi:MAG: sulfite exporter TauE/SafE family protein [Melioribacteraceae bacterium]|nr:sulfite exporter TauE/SafE family protein [Melioribacteraceae bacterium]MDD3557468.1 sulfite exporter TauE/SafE family protein [Melioribacteraceae bacterium]